MKCGICNLFLISVIVLSSCSPKPGYLKLVGDWKLYEADLDSVTLDTSFVNKAKRSLESSNFGFLADKSFQITDLSFSGGSYAGVWEYSARKKKLTLFYPGLHIDPEEYDVIKLTGRSLILRLEVPSAGIFVYKLKKIKN